MTDQEFVTTCAGAIAGYLFQQLRINPGVDYRARVPAFAPRAISLELAINPSHVKRLAGMTEELSMAVGLSGEQTVRIRRGFAGRLIIEIPKPRQLWRPVGVSSLRRRAGMVAPVGLGMSNEQTVIDLSDPLTPHVLVAGGTGSGKTTAGRLIVFDLARQNGPDDLNLILIDTRKHGAAWSNFARLPHLLHPIITQESEALSALGWLVAELDKRGRERRNTPRLFVGIDEAQSLLAQTQFVKPISDLAAVGREWGVHLGLLVQNPTAEVLSDVSIKRNIQSRLVGKVDSAIAANVATGMTATGAELLTGAGDMLLASHGDVKRVTTALVAQKDFDRLPMTEAINTLALSRFEDISHVVEQANLMPTGRPSDPLDPEQVYSVLVNPEISQNELYRRFSIGRAKQKAVIDFARAILDFMSRDGYQICGPERNAGTEQN